MWYLWGRTEIREMVWNGTEMGLYEQSLSFNRFIYKAKRSFI